MTANTIYLPMRPDDPCLADIDQNDPDVWWRAECLTSFPNYPMIRFAEYRMIKTTACGHWFESVGWNVQLRTWRSKGSRYVSRTKRQALDRLLGRKQAHVKYAKARLEDAECQLRHVKHTVEFLNQHQGEPVSGEESA